MTHSDVVRLRSYPAATPDSCGVYAPRLRSYPWPTLHALHYLLHALHYLLHLTRYYLTIRHTQLPCDSHQLGINTP